jgi:hypothetical protein
MSSGGHDSYYDANKMEAANGESAAQLERLQTAGGHINDSAIASRGTSKLCKPSSSWIIVFRDWLDFRLSDQV